MDKSVVWPQVYFIFFEAMKVKLILFCVILRSFCFKFVLQCYLQKKSSCQVSRLYICSNLLSNTSWRIEVRLFKCPCNHKCVASKELFLLSTADLKWTFFELQSLSPDNEDSLSSRSTRTTMSMPCFCLHRSSQSINMQLVGRNIIKNLKPNNKAEEKIE